MKSANASAAASVKRWLKRFPILVALKRATFRKPERSILNIVETMELYAPNSAGTYKDRAAATIQAANLLVPFLGELSRSVGKHRLSAMKLEEFPKDDSEVESARKLKTFFDTYGSDKAHPHKYHNVYGPILKNRNEIRAILEIGIGTNFTDVISNMGIQGSPGASLRAFRDFLPNAQIFGADVDKRILFQEQRISTHYVDQTDLSTLSCLADETPNDFDLIIDDGLHTPAANIAALAFAIKKVRIGGWIVIEDIPDRALPVWDVVAALLPNSYTCLIGLGDKVNNVFAVQRSI